MTLDAVVGTLPANITLCGTPSGILIWRNNTRKGSTCTLQVSPKRGVERSPTETRWLKTLPNSPYHRMVFKRPKYMPYTPWHVNLMIHKQCIPGTSPVPGRLYRKVFFWNIFGMTYTRVGHLTLFQILDIIYNKVLLYPYLDTGTIISQHCLMYSTL